MNYMLELASDQAVDLRTDTLETRPFGLRCEPESLGRAIRAVETATGLRAVAVEVGATNHIPPASRVFTPPKITTGASS